MVYIKIDKTTSVPLYKQIYLQIKQKITNKTIGHMDLLPSEKQFAHLYDISNFVVKRAYKMLKDENLIIGIKGRGTYVFNRTTYVADAFKPETVVFPIDKSYTYHILNVAPVYPSQYLSNTLKIPLEKKVMQTKMIILSNGYPLAYVELSIIKGFKINLDDWLQAMLPIKTYLMNKVQCPVHITTSINAASADWLMSDILKVDSNSSLVIAQSIYKTKDQMIGYSKVVYPGSFFRLKAVK